VTSGGRGDTPSILILIEAPIATTQIVEQVIGACRRYGIQSSTRLLRELRPEEIGPNVLPLFIRCADPTSLPWVKALAAQGKPYLYYLDDDFWGLNDGSPLSLYYSDRGVRRALDFFVAKAEAVLTNSPVLAAVLEQREARAVEVLPTFFDFSLLDDIAVAPTDEIRIGFAGSSSRAGDLDLIRPIIDPLIAQFPAVVFEFAGTLPKGVPASDRVRFFPSIGNYADFIRFKASRNWSIGLAPLRDRPSNLAKTDNKFREYGACRIASVYSNIQPYTDVVTDGVTGLLVDNTPEAWREAITALVTNSARRSSIAAEAYNLVRDKYDLDRAAAVWAEAIGRISAPVVARTGTGLSVATLRREKLAAASASLWLGVRISYATGGLPLVARRTLRRLTKMLFGRAVADGK